MSRRARGVRQVSRSGSNSGNSPSTELDPVDGATAEQSVDALLRKIPPDTPQEIVELIASYSGPLPPPSMFAHYDETLPGAADRILKMVEIEQQIRSRDNRTVLTSDRIRVLGSIFVSLALVAAAAYSAFLGQPILAATLGTSGVIAALFKEIIRDLFRRGK